jgi:hypothetical protein
MDCFHLESLEHFIKKFKTGIVYKLENIRMTEKDLINHSDLVNMVLDYSPRLIEEKRLNGKI